VCKRVAESIVTALVAARTMTGINGNTVHALPHRRYARCYANTTASQADPRRKRGEMVKGALSLARAYTLRD
jgi:hypothetical protein